jgi:hypothetical protein
MDLGIAMAGADPSFLRDLMINGQLIILVESGVELTDRILFGVQDGRMFKFSTTLTSGFRIRTNPVFSKRVDTITSNRERLKCRGGPYDGKEMFITKRRGHYTKMIYSHPSMPWSV